MGAGAAELWAVSLVGAGSRWCGAERGGKAAAVETAAVVAGAAANRVSELFSAPAAAAPVCGVPQACNANFLM